jgi:molybdopterin synthase sulfur carrier subunit
MSVTVRIPQPLRKLTENKDTVSAGGGTVLDLISNLEASYPGLRERLCDETGELRRFVNVYLNGEDIRFADGLSTGVKDGDEVSIVPAMAGGA